MRKLRVLQRASAASRADAQKHTCSRNSSIERFKKSISDILARIVWFSDVSVSITAASISIVFMASRSQTLVLLGDLHIQLINLSIKHHLHLV